MGWGVMVIAMVLVACAACFREPIAERYRAQNAFTMLAVLYGIVIATLLTVVVVNRQDGGIVAVLVVVGLMLALGWLTYYFGSRNTVARLTDPMATREERARSSTPTAREPRPATKAEHARRKTEIKYRIEILGFVTTMAGTLAIGLNALALEPDSYAKFLGIGLACCMVPLSSGALARKLALARYERDDAVKAWKDEQDAALTAHEAAEKAAGGAEMR